MSAWSGAEARRVRCPSVTARPADPPHCRCAVCLARTSGEATRPAGAEADPQLELLCRHTVEMMRLEGASEEEKQRLVKQLQVMVPSGAQQAPSDDPFPFQLLPAEIQLAIFSFLSARELCTSVLPVCRSWYSLGRDPVLWQHLSFEADNLVPTPTVVSILSFSTLLKTLRLEARCHVDKILFQVADSCKQLRSLTAKFCDGLNSLLLEVIVKHCPMLERVNFEGSRFDDPGCTSALTGLEHLRALNVSHCLRLEDAELVEMARRCRHLEELNVDGIGYLTNAAVQELVSQAGDRLLCLVLDGENLTDAGFKALGQCRSLEALCISFADGMTDASLEALSTLHSLMRLKIRRGHKLSAAALARLFQGQNMPCLIHLDLSECSNVDDVTVDALTANCPLLTFLALSWCWDITDTGLERIVTRLRFMRVLDLVGVVRITGQCFQLIPERLPELRHPEPGAVLGRAGRGGGAGGAPAAAAAGVRLLRRPCGAAARGDGELARRGGRPPAAHHSQPSDAAGGRRGVTGRHGRHSASDTTPTRFTQPTAQHIPQW